MIEIEEFEGGFRVVDAAKNEVRIEIDVWEPGGEELEISYDVTETITGSGAEIRLPNGGFAIQSSELDDPQMLNMNERVCLNPGDHSCRLGTPITVFVCIQAPGETTAENSGRGIRLSFTERTRFTLGFKESDSFEVERVAVSPTPGGVASAIETCASMHRTERPERSFPSERPSLPTIEVTDGPDNPDVGVREVEEPIRFRVPRSLDFLYPLAPLAFYLGAGVTVERRTEPILELGSDVHEFSRDSQFSHEVASLLRRVFYLDCLVREVGPRRLGIKEFELVENLPIDIHDLYESRMLERIQAYFDVPFETIDAGLPDWPLGTYVDTTAENLPALSYLLEKLSFILPPKATPIDGETLVERSLGDFYRSSAESATPAGADRIRPDETLRTQVRGWLAPGAPFEAFKCLPEAISNGPEYLVPTSEPIQVKLVLNDGTMAFERSKALRICRDRSEELSIELNVIEDATVGELASTMESRTDFLHYIGHCDESGFRCVDGNFSAERLSRSRARTFFLNACGSYSEGVELVRKGSVAGAVTFGDVIDAQAAKVGVDFARMYMHGYTIERALYHARGQAIMNQQYTIVGDGTHVLTQGDSIQPAVAQITPLEDETYSVRLDGTPVNLNGSVILPYADSLPNLAGNDPEARLNKEELYEWIPTTNDPLVYDNKFYWPEELLDELF